MKAFVVAALLVVSVAGQSLDTFKPFNRDLISRKGLTSFNRPTYNNHYGGDYSNLINNDYYDPSIYNQVFGGDYDYTTSNYMNVLSYDEITMHPLFREYMSFPIFRQYWSYPIFQKYVCSHYFQQYWTMPTFQQYFVQPELFYKYIYPIVQLFKYEQTSMNTYTGGDFIYGNNKRNFYPFAYGGDYYNQQQQVSVNGNYGIPAICYSNSMYCRALVQKMYNHLMYSSKMMTPESMMTPTTDDVYKYNPYFSRMTYPTMYNNVYNKEFQNFEIPAQTVYNNDVIRQVLTSGTTNKGVIGDKTAQLPIDQLIKA